MLAKVYSFSFSHLVLDLQPWQQVALGFTLVVIVAICAIIGREIYYAVHPDKRPRKRRRRPKN
ncbi:MAG: hypothetical protein ACXW3Z_04205 [Limisphaerales bacterium]